MQKHIHKTANRFTHKYKKYMSRKRNYLKIDTPQI